MKCSYFVPVIERYPLRLDCCRCHDEDCPDRDGCQRWTDRREGDANQTPHAFSLRKDASPMEGGAT